MIVLRPFELRQRRASGELWQVLDVREAWEVRIASVGDAIEIPMGEIPSRMEEIDKSQPVAVLCHSGVRSAHVATWLLAQGFATVANIDGGIDAWSIEVDGSVPRY